MKIHKITEASEYLGVSINNLLHRLMISDDATAADEYQRALLRADITDGRIGCWSDTPRLDPADGMMCKILVFAPNPCLPLTPSPLLRRRWCKQDQKKQTVSRCRRPFSKYGRPLWCSQVRSDMSAADYLAWLGSVAGLAASSDRAPLYPLTYRAPPRSPRQT